MSGSDRSFRKYMLSSGACKESRPSRRPRPMRRTGSEVIGMALCLPPYDLLTMHGLIATSI